MTTNARLIIMTNNIGNGYAPHRSLLPALRESGADVIAIQEVSEEDAAAFDRELRDVYPHQSLHGYGVSGKAVLSRKPIVAEETFSLHTERFHLQVAIDYDGTAVHVINTHLPPPIFDGRVWPAWHGRVAQAEISDLLAKAQTTHGPTVMLGDFNKLPRNQVYAISGSDGLRDVFNQVEEEPGPTFPRRFGVLPWMPPMFRIDYIWHSQQFTVNRAWVGPDTGSDHLPVLAELSLNV
jgi:vancomycin resistance protein VanJ